MFEYEIPMVSVRFMVYNNEPYIRQAIESILTQETTFKVEIVVGDDFSSDETLNIIKGYESTENVKIRILQRDVNGEYWEKRKKLGHRYNFTNIISHCNGKYLALLDGDDYWTDPYKLQKQYDFMESNPDTAICFHRAHTLKNNELNLHPVPKEVLNSKFDYIELLHHYNFITTASVMIRKPENFLLPEWFKVIPFGDLGLYKIVSQNKFKIACLNEVMSVYRVHASGIYSGISEYQAKRNYLTFYRVLYPHLLPAEQRVVENKKKALLTTMSKLKFPNSKILQKFFYIYLKFKG